MMWDESTAKVIGEIVQQAAVIMVEIKPLQVGLLALGLSLTAIFSAVYLWRHVRRAIP